MAQDQQAERRQVLINALRKPQTLRELMKATGVSYHTLWRALKELQEAGLVKETPFRDGREKQYIAISSSDSGVLQVITKGGATEIGSLINEPASQVMLRPVVDIVGILAQVYRYHRFVGETTVEKAKAGSMTPIECKGRLRQVLDELKSEIQVVEQLLLAPMWEPTGSETAEKFGAVDELQAVTLGARFEKRMGR